MLLLLSLLLLVMWTYQRDSLKTTDSVDPVPEIAPDLDLHPDRTHVASALNFEAHHSTARSLLEKSLVA